MRRATVLVALLALGASPAARQASGLWREAPEYLPLFAPAGDRRLAYRALVTPLDLESVLRGLADDPAAMRPPGAWEPHLLLPFEAFGQTGGYDRWALARLYGARRPQVARGPRGTAGRVAESWTLISPYPDPTLGRLEPGTLLIVLSLDGS